MLRLIESCLGYPSLVLKLTTRDTSTDLRVGEAHSNSAHCIHSRTHMHTHTLALTRTHTLSHSHAHTHSLEQRGGNRGFIYIFWVPAKTSFTVAAPADSITSKGNIVVITFVPSYIISHHLPSVCTLSRMQLAGLALLVI